MIIILKFLLYQKMVFYIMQNIIVIINLKQKIKLLKNQIQQIHYKNNNLTYDNGKIKIESNCDMNIKTKIV